MSCKICKSSQPCGCKDTPLSIPPNYVTDPTICPDPTPCSEIFDSQCICYSGDLLECAGQTWTIPTGTDVETVIQTLFNALCEVATTGGGQQGFNILVPTNDGDTTTWGSGEFTGVNGSAGGTSTTTGDELIHADRNNCFDDITLTLSWDAGVFPNITALEWNSIGGGTVLTIPAIQSFVGIEIIATQTVATPETFAFTITWEACGVTKVQTGDFDIT